MQLQNINIFAFYTIAIRLVILQESGHIRVSHNYVGVICIKLKAHYHTILRLMPDDYELTVGKLVNCISDDQICTILSSSNSTVANKIILDCLIERMRCREELLDLCDQVEKITTSHDMKIVINEIRLG